MSDGAHDRPKFAGTWDPYTAGGIRNDGSPDGSVS
jgi:hypothetical protein